MLICIFRMGIGAEVPYFSLVCLFFIASLPRPHKQSLSSRSSGLCHSPPEEANQQHACSSRICGGGENHAQSFVVVVVCSGSSVDVQRARTGADCERGCFRAMGGEHGLLRDDDLFSDGAEAGGRKAEREF